MAKKRKKRSITLIEIMIVILLIGLIGGALAFNMSGSMDRGRAFKTEQNMARIEDILMMEYAKGDQSLEDIAKEWESVVKRSPLVVKQGKDVMTDGWKKTFNVTYKDGELKITSEAFAKYQDTHEKR